MTVQTRNRTLRPSGYTGVRVEPLLAAVVLAELLSPSKELWLVSAWITDVDVVDNSTGAYDGVFGDTPPLSCRFSDALAQMCGNGARLNVVTKPDRHNDIFLRRLQAQAAPDRLRVTRAVEIHEKTFCGDHWVLMGSMNFTVRGMTVNDEAVVYSVEEDAPALARLDLARRWEDEG